MGAQITGVTVVESARCTFYVSYLRGTLISSKFLFGSSTRSKKYAPRPSP